MEKVSEYELLTFIVIFVLAEKKARGFEPRAGVKKMNNMAPCGK
jgi:hypothetical protein